ncbi:MAG: HEAT repeat domain-containing protein [bacterium]|nr:HEAT repeat domain-containing protein [bacterium]
MSERDVQIQDHPEGQGPPSASGANSNLWGLVVAPAGIVIAIMVVGALFGALTGSESSLDENLELVVHGGKNQSTQALFNLARQASENQRAHAQRLAGGDVELPWPMAVGFPQRVRDAAGELDEDEHETRLVLAVLLSTLGEPEGSELLRGFLELGDSEDPDQSLRMRAIQNLGILGDSAATEAVIGFLDHDEHVLRLAAAGALSQLPGEGVGAALEAALGDGVLDVRATAALSASKLDPPIDGAGPLLRDLTGTEIYSAEREQDPQRFTRARDVSQFRVLAVTALGRLALAEDRAFLESLREDSDLLVAEAAMKVLETWGGDVESGQ